MSPCITARTARAPGAWRGPAILVIIVVLVIAAARAGYTPPELITVLLVCACLAGCRDRLASMAVIR